jgi:prepilin-type N-terminal cleavage/methylation domain-containing protein
MKNILLLKILKQWTGHSSKKDYASIKGFSLIELMVVILMVGVLAAIAAPSWDAFTSRQRLKNVNTQVSQVIKTAQAEAKRSKEGRRITFINDAGTPKVEVYNVKNTFADETDDTLIEKKSLNVEGEVKPGTLTIYTQASGKNANSISFNYLGAIPDEETEKVKTPEKPEDAKNTDGFTIVTYLSNNKDTRQCVIVQSLLGAMRTAEKTDCPTSP